MLMTTMEKEEEKQTQCLCLSVVLIPLPLLPLWSPSLSLPRDMVGGVDSGSLSPHFRRGATRPTPPSLPDCSDCHELETLMPPRTLHPPSP